MNLELTDGVCSACKTAEDFSKISTDYWLRRREVLDSLVAETRKSTEGKYDCVIPVSGGKDSYYQTHTMIEEYGLKPLLVTYHGFNYLPEGDFNRDRMRQVFNADHLVFGPSVEVLKKLNKIAFRKIGDMNWHAHCGIFTYPIQIATSFKIPLIIWGEIAWDIAGMFGPDDVVEFSARTRHEHALRGHEWDSMLTDGVETLEEKDFNWAKYPHDREILEAGVKGIYLGNFFPWNPAEHTKMVKEKYGWQESPVPFQRTYRLMSNLDDRYENGIHDLMKFVKFGYGRGSDHASKDIRLGVFDRETGIEMVRKYDHVVSDDLFYWLEYVEMNESEFWATADTFRDPRVWWIKNNEWLKSDIDGEIRSYGKVHLAEHLQSKFIR